MPTLQLLNRDREKISIAVVGHAVDSTPPILLRFLSGRMISAGAGSREPEEISTALAIHSLAGQ